MSTEDRLRPHPHDRWSGAPQPMDLVRAARDLRAEPHPGIDGHRQVAIIRDGPVIVVLFAFETGAVLKEHRAPGTITIHALTGRLRVTVSGTAHELPAGSLICLAPGIPHDVHALEQADMLLTVSHA